MKLFAAQLSLSSSGSGCDAPLGLQSGLITDDQLSSSLHDSNPEHARLHHPVSAWCFLYSSVKQAGDDVFLEVDLGQPSLVSGFQSQGPPETLHGVKYMRYISLGVDVSLDREEWQDCCSQDGAKTNFYADDKNNEIDSVRTHPFANVVVARYVRISISTGLRWIGHDDKCFRQVNYNH